MNASTPIVEELENGCGAIVMGRNMFGPIGGGDWGDGSWKGWWGDEPAVPHAGLRAHPPRAGAGRDGGRHHLPLRHRRHRVGARAGARRRPGDEDVQIAGGANTIQQYLAAGLVDEFQLNVVPDSARRRRAAPRRRRGPELEQVEAIEAPGRHPPQVPRPEVALGRRLSVAKRDSRSRLVLSTVERAGVRSGQPASTVQRDDSG